MMNMHPIAILALALAISGCALPACAQGELRDPLQAPASLRAASPAASAAETETLLPQQIIVVEGRPYLVVQGRRLGVGERWGEARILAIDEQAVTLSEGGVKRRLPLYQGVEKRPLTAAPAAGRARKKTSEKS
ncbi:hypothetical protein [Paucibacter soli]|uniref:hypothetical protein n=1 Tax=Paucibacter soli TaxID=3133433 RepID=UPI0030A121BE